MPSWLTTAMSIITGGILTMVAGWLSDQRLTQRDRERRRDERKDRLIAERENFQRDTLLELQVASQKLLRNAGAALHQDRLAYKASGRWQQQQLPEGLSDDQHRLNTDTLLLSSRVRDDEVRNLTQQLRSQTVSVGHSSTETEALRCMTMAADVQRVLIERIGQIIRELDEKS